MDAVNLGNKDDLTTILVLFGLGYLLFKSRKVKEVIKTEYVEPFKRLKAGTSTHYSPYTKRYFDKGILRRFLYG